MSVLPTPKFAIGQAVYFPSVDATRERLPCPDCSDSKVWTITSPAGVELQMDCPRCTRSHHGDALDLHRSKHVPRVRTITIGRVSIDTNRTDPVEYGDSPGGCYSIYRESQLFESYDDALSVAQIKADEAQAKEMGKPEAMRATERARLGYFDALKEQLRDQARRDVGRMMAADMGLTEAFEVGEPTPGEWKASGEYDGNGLYHFSVEAVDPRTERYRGITVCDGYGGLCEGWATHEQGPANVRLIAAAPNLLRAVEGLLSIIDESKGVTGYHLNGEPAEWAEFGEVEEARKAVAKATGGEA